MIHLSLVLTHLERKVDALEKDKLAQATEILCLKKRVKMLEKRKKSKPSVLRIGSATRVESLEEANETQRMDDDLIFDTIADLGGEEVVVKPAETGVSTALDVEVSAAEPVVTTVSLLVTTDSVTITVAEPDLSAHDEQVPKDLHDKFQVELKEEAKRQEEASMAALAELHDAVQAHIDADQELAARMTLEEHEKYTVEERARMLAEFIKNRKKWFTHAQLKHRDFEQIQGLYNKEKELVDTFVHNGSEEDERRIKDLNTKGKEESSNKDVDSTNKRKERIRMKRSSKKQKTNADLKKEEQLKTFLSIVPNEEEATDGSSRYIKTFTEMVSKFDRMDFLELHSLMMQRFKTTTLEGIDLILWGDLKTMFEANAVDKLWKNQEDWILKSWNLYENCRVHILMLENGIVFHMLAERKYLLTKETLKKMLVLRLTVES
ncbi:hypothetical protein Tco_0763805 [Tanacetum coccineum]